MSGDRGHQTDMFEVLDQGHFLDGIEARPAAAPEPAHQGRCQGCKGVIAANTSQEWHRKVRRPCPHCGRERW